MVYGKTPFQDIKMQHMKIDAISNPNHKIGKNTLCYMLST